MVSCLGWSMTAFLSAYATTAFHLIILRMILGFFYALYIPTKYSLIADYFPPLLRTKAFTIFCVVTQLGDSLSALTINIIVIEGWRGAFQICGIFGFVIFIIGVVFMKEPCRDHYENDAIIDGHEVTIKDTEGSK